MLHVETVNYGNQLFVATSIKTGGIYFASRKQKKFNELGDEFEKRYPDLVNDVVMWYHYVDQISRDTAKAIQNGAFMPCHLFPDVTKYTQTIFEVEFIIDGGVGNTYKTTRLYRTRDKATEQIDKTIKENNKNLRRIVLKSVELDTNFEEILREYNKDEHGRMVKAKVEQKGA